MAAKQKERRRFIPEFIREAVGLLSLGAWIGTVSLFSLGVTAVLIPTAEVAYGIGFLVIAGSFAAALSGLGLAIAKNHGSMVGPRSIHASWIALATGGVLLLAIHPVPFGSYWGWSRLPTPATSTWYDIHVRALELQASADSATKYLGLHVAFLVIFSLSAWAGWSIRLHRAVALTLVAVSCVIVAGLCTTRIRAGRLPDQTDPHWDMGYVREGECYMYLQYWGDQRIWRDGLGLVTRELSSGEGQELLREHLGADATRLSEKCREACLEQLERNRWNPGIMEEPCRRFLTEP